MNDAQLLCFVSVAQTLSFRRAAEELEMSQPSVTKQIAALESELGGTLFARSTRTVSLTDFGESFLPDAREILQIMSDASDKAKKKAMEGHLIVGYNDVGQLYCISKVLEKFRKLHPNVGITLKLGSRDDSTEWLNRGSLDLYFGFYADSLVTGSVVYDEILSTRLCFVANVNSEFADFEIVKADDLVGKSQIVCVPLAYRRRAAKRRRALPEAAGAETMYCETTAEALTLVDAGYGFTLVPTAFATPGENRVIVPWEGEYRSSYGVFSNENSDNPLIDSMIKVASEVFAAGENGGKK